MNVCTKFEVRSFTRSLGTTFKNSDSPCIRPRFLFSQWAFVRMDPVNVPAKFEVCSFTIAWDNMGYSKNWAAHAVFSAKFCNGLLFWWTHWMYRPNLRSVALRLPGIIVIGVLGGVTKIWGRGGRRRSEMVPFERALVSSYKPLVTFPLSLRVS